MGLSVAVTPRLTTCLTRTGGEGARLGSAGVEGSPNESRSDDAGGR